MKPRCYYQHDYRDIVKDAIDRWQEWAGSAERAVLIFKSKLAWMPKRAWPVAAWLEREATGEWPTVTVPVDRDAKSLTKVKTVVPYLDNDQLDDYAPSQDDLTRIAELMIRILPTVQDEKEVEKMTTEYAAAKDEVSRLLTQGLSPDQISAQYPEIWKIYNAGPKDSPSDPKGYHAQLDQEKKEAGKHMKAGGAKLDQRARELMDSGEAETYKKAMAQALEEDPQSAKMYLEGIGG